MVCCFLAVWTSRMLFPNQIFLGILIVYLIAPICLLLFNTILKPDGSVGKESVYKARDIGDMGLIPRSRRSPGRKMATHSSILA